MTSATNPGDLRAAYGDAGGGWSRARRIAVIFGAMLSGIALGSTLWWTSPHIVTTVVGSALGPGLLDDALAVSAVALAASLTAVLCLRVVWAREREAGRLLAELEARTRDLDASQDELRQLARFVSHELRQPLAALGIWTELLKSRCSPDADEQVCRYLREISVTVHRIGALIAVQSSASQHARAMDPLHAAAGPHIADGPRAAEARGVEVLRTVETGRGERSAALPRAANDQRTR
jgi:signal transduction histidine kinase